MGAPHHPQQQQRNFMPPAGDAGRPGMAPYLKQQSMPQLYQQQQQQQQQAGWGELYHPHQPQQPQPRGMGQYQLGIDTGEGLDSGRRASSQFQPDKATILNVATTVLNGLESVGTRLASAVNAAASKYGIFNEEGRMYQSRVSVSGELVAKEGQLNVCLSWEFRVVGFVELE
ncbi:hypothetical protein HK104_009545 [Borealophlyctis nickersoniae]|nr:hypothetical protein HK104_009545 [Borealophlyctis nickersoniae]